MKLLNLLAIAPLTLVVATSAGAQEKAPATSEKKVCRSEEAATGSIMPAKRVCHTKTEWAAIDKAHAENVERFQAARDIQRTPAR